MSNILAPTVCQSGEICFAGAAGFYDMDASKTPVQISQTGDRQNTTLSGLTYSANWTFDTISRGVELLKLREK